MSENLSWLIPEYTPDVWLARVKNRFDYFGLGFLVLIFIILYFGFLASLLAPSSPFSSFGIIGFFLFTFGFVVAGLALVAERTESHLFNFVLYGRSANLKALGFDYMLGGVVGVGFALPSLLPFNVSVLSVAPSTPPVENVLIIVLFAILEELYRASTFEPLLGTFLKGGSEIPILLMFLAIISFFIPTFLSVPLIGVLLAVLALVFAFTPLRNYITYYQVSKHATIILIGAISWVLYHVLTAASYSNPYTLYTSAFAFGLIIDTVNAIRQSAIPSYTAHIVNNAIVGVRQLGYDISLALFTIFIFLALLAFPVALNRKGGISA